MSVVKRLAKKIPGLALLHHHLSNYLIDRKARSQSMEERFTDIYRWNRERGLESASGTGSFLEQTKTIVEQLPLLFNELGIKTVLDLPCGDFYWMQHVEMDGVKYVGGDIVQEIVNGNRKKYENSNVSFEVMDVVADDLPTVDLVIVRDLFVHLPLANIDLALRNLCRSMSKYLLTTTFVARTDNQEVITGKWRTLNLEKEPFNLSPPERVINEGCNERGGAFSDKSLALWRLEAVEESLS